MTSVSVKTEQKVSVIKVDDTFAMRKCDWKRIQRLVNNLPKQEKYLSNLYSTFFGIGISAGLTLIPLYNMPNLSPWIFPSLLITVFASILLSIILFSVDRSNVKKSKNAIDEVNTQISEINELYD